MGGVNLQLVREFFELNLFRVLTNWQQGPRLSHPADHSGQLFVDNSDPGAPGDLPFVLRPSDLPAIDRAVVEVRAWHTDRFYPSVIEANPVLTQFASEQSLALAHEVFGRQSFVTILVLSELPATQEHRARSLALLKNTRVDHVMEFPLLLQDLLQKVNVNGNYPASQTLQTLRLLKRYKLTRNQQMEFMFSTEPIHPVSSVQVDTARAASADNDSDE